MLLATKQLMPTTQAIKRKLSGTILYVLKPRKALTIAMRRNAIGGEPYSISALHPRQTEAPCGTVPWQCGHTKSLMCYPFFVKNFC